MTITATEATIALSAFALLTVSAASDISSRTIPNWTSLGLIILFPILAFFSTSGVNLVSHIGSFAVVFCTTFLLWHFGFLGGGDVKLMSALALWADWQLLGPFVIVVTLAGGFIAVAFAFLKYWSLYMLPAFGGGTCSPSADAESDSLQDQEEKGTNPTQEPVTVPYGVAIAVGGLWLILQHVPLIG